MFKINYKIRKGDTYDNLVQRFGPTVLSNAGIYDDSDIKIGLQFEFKTSTRELAELLQKRDLEWLKELYDNVINLNAKTFDTFWAENGNDFMARYGRELNLEEREKLKNRLRLEYIYGSNSIKKLLDKAEKFVSDFWLGKHAGIDSGFNNLEPKYYKQVQEEFGRPLTDLERKFLTNHTSDYENFVKMGKGKTYLDYLNYLDSEHKDALSTKRYATNAGYGIVGMAAALPILTNSAPLLQSSIVRSIAGSETARELAKKAGLDESYQTAASYLGGGFGGLSRQLLQNGIRGTLVEGLSNSIGLAVADQTNKALENTSNYIKYPASMITGFFGRRAFNSGIRNSIKNTKWGEDLITQNKNNSSSAFSSLGHVQSTAEGITNVLKDESRPFIDRGSALLKNGIIYGGALAMKTIPMIGTGIGIAGALDIAGNFTDNLLIKDAMNYAVPFVTNKMYGTYLNFNKGNAQFLTYSSGGTGKGIGSAMQNTAKIALRKPRSVNKELRSARLSTPQLIRGLSIATWDSLPIHYNNGKFGRNYKPGGYGFLYYTTKGNLGGDWGNLNASGYVGHNPITHMYSGAPLGVGIQSSGLHTRLGSRKNNLLDNIVQRLFPKGSGYDTRYGDRPIEITFAGNRVDLNSGKWAKSFDKHGNVTEWTTNPNEASVRHTNYNVDTGHRTMLNNKVQNLAVNTKGLQTMVWQDPEGNTFSIGGDLYGVGSGKTNLLSSMYGAYMDAHANPIITLSANKYTPTKTKGTLSFGSEVFPNLPHYKRGGKFLGIKSYGL